MLYNVLKHKWLYVYVYIIYNHIYIYIYIMWDIIAFASYSAHHTFSVSPLHGQNQRGSVRHRLLWSKMTLGIPGSRQVVPSPWWLNTHLGPWFSREVPHHWNHSWGVEKIRVMGWKKKNIIHLNMQFLVDGWATPLKNHESQLGSSFQINSVQPKKKHQPGSIAN